MWSHKPAHLQVLFPVASYSNQYKTAWGQGYIVSSIAAQEPGQLRTLQPKLPCHHSFFPISSHYARGIILRLQALQDLFSPAHPTAQISAIQEQIKYSSIEPFFEFTVF